MSGKPRRIAAENPFCTRRVRPGALPFLVPDDRPLQMLVDRLRRQDWWGEIVGPHGSGKSALLASLVPAMEEARRPVCHIELHDGQRRLPIDVHRLPEANHGRVLVIDGLEQLGRPRRIWLKRFCRRRRWGLVVTAHMPVGLPELYRAAPELSLAQRLVEQLQQGYAPLIDASDVAEVFAEHRGDLREMLFTLYDRYERRRRDAPSKPGR